MAAQTITPKAETAPTALTEIAGSAVPVGEEWSVDVRVANKSAAEALYRLALGPTGDSGSSLYRVYDESIPVGEARDIERQLVIPAGWALFHRASAAAAVDVTVTGRKRATA